MSIGPHLLGRRQEHDPASRAYTASLRRSTAPLKPVTHTLRMPHLDQADVACCEGDTAMEWLGCAQSINSRRSFWAKAGAGRSSRYPTQAQALAAYALATRLDDFPAPNFPGVDMGTSGLGIAKAMQQMAAIERYLWTFSWQGYLGQLQTGPIMLGTNWYEGMFEHDRKGVVHARGDMAGGHAYLAFAYRPKGMRLADGSRLAVGMSGCTNHWVNDDGSVWGVRIGEHPGCFWITDDELEQLLITERGESLVPVPL